MDALFPLILFLLFLIYVLWKVLSGMWSRPAAPTTTRTASDLNSRSTSQEFHWNGKGDFEFEIVGESNYQRALESLAGEHGTESAEAHHTATLILEDSNPHDPKAVAVQVAGRTVGYLAREDARSYRRRLGQKRLSGVDATCDAIVVGGGTRRSGEKLFYGVKLGLNFGSPS